MTTPLRKPLLLHHHDLDGYAAGILALLAFPDAEARSLSYDQPGGSPAPEEFENYDTVIVVDYSLPPETMLWLKQNRKLIWIDHHISAIKLSQEKGYDDAEGLRCAPGALVCGAELAWKYFQKERPIPRFLKLVGDYDTFRNAKTTEFKTKVLPFNLATKLCFDRLKPANFHRPDFLIKTPDDFEREELCNKLIEQGTVIQQYNESYYAGLLPKNAFVRTIWGVRCLCFNCPGSGSANIQQAFDVQKHDLILRFSYNGTCWGYGIYTDADAKPMVNCAEIAKQYGGGGHTAAAGFSTKELLPELLTDH